MTRPPRPARPLFVLDYDGTLAPIVSDPAAAVPHADVPALLARLARAHPVVVVTGRDLAALARLLTGPDGRPVGVRAVGLHGAEWGVLGGPPSPTGLDAHVAELGRMRATVPVSEGVVVEEKGAAFAVHYRLAPDPAAARAALGRWVAAAPAGLEPVWGKCVVELRARGVSKGTAVARLAAERPDCTPVALGDDVTDEDAFLALGPDAVTIKVGPGPTAARFRLPDVDAAVAYLDGFLSGTSGTPLRPPPLS